MTKIIDMNIFNARIIVYYEHFLKINCVGIKYHKCNTDFKRLYFREIINILHKHKKNKIK